MEYFKKVTILLVAVTVGLSMPLVEVVFLVQTGSISKLIEFLVVNIESLYNVILGRGWLHGIKATLSTYYHNLKFITDGG